MSEQSDQSGPAPQYPQYPSGGPGGLPYAPPAGLSGPPATGPGGPDGPPTRNGMGIAALVLGVVGLLIVAFTGLGVLLALVGLVLGIVAWARAGRLHRAKGVAIAGTVVSALVLVGGFALIAAEVGHADNACKGTPKHTSAYTQCIKDNSKL